MISLHDVGKLYPGANGQVNAVEAVSLEVEAGECVVLLGESGCGKTTTLKMINRLVERSSGEIRVGEHSVDDVDPVQLRRSIGYVFQGIGLFPHHDVADNVAAVPKLLGWPNERIRERVDELLELVGLEADAFRDRRPRELSGGQQQRVGVARALAARSSILLMDEPFGALDPVTRDALQRELAAMRTRLDLTIVLVTHDVAEALLLADRIAVMRDGRIEQVATPARLLGAPATPYVESLLEAPRRNAERLQALSEAGAGGSGHGAPGG